MCGRYYVNEITWTEVQKMLAAAEGRLRMEAAAEPVRSVFRRT